MRMDTCFTIGVIGLRDDDDMYVMVNNTLEHYVCCSVYDDGIYVLTMADDDYNDFIVSYNFVSIRSDQLIECDCILVIPMTSSCDLDILHQLRYYNMLSDRNNISIPIILAYPNESTSLIDIENMCVTVTDYFTTSSTATIHALCSSLIQYPNIAMIRSISIMNIYVYDAVWFNNYMTDYAINTCISYFNECNSYQIYTHLGCISMHTSNAIRKYYISVYVRNQCDINTFDISNPYRHQSFIVLVLLVDNITIPIKSTYHRHIEKRLCIDRCILVYDNSIELLHQILSVACNGIDIKFIPCLY